MSTVVFENWFFGEAWDPGVGGHSQQENHRKQVSGSNCQKNMVVNIRADNLSVTGEKEPGWEGWDKL